MPAVDLSLLIAAAQEAGKIATSYAPGSAKAWEKPDGSGPVTEADLAVNAMLEDTLQAARPDYGWLSEETEDTAERLGRDHVFIIDPIDGTRSYMEGGRTWAHSLAVAERGRVTAGVIYLPRRDLLFCAAEGQGAWLNDQKITPSAQKDLSGANVLATKPSLRAEAWRQGPPEFQRSYRPSLAYRLALVAQGRFDAMVTLRAAWEWDIAAGHVILAEAGARCTDKSGASLRFNNAHPQVSSVIASGPALHEQIIGALA